MSRKAWLAAPLAVIAAVGTAVTQLVGAAPALASPGHGTATVVSIGDSFIAGEGGRLAGNSDNPATDRGMEVYGSTVYGIQDGKIVGGCHRSDSAPVFGAPLSTFQRLNIACSGASSWNVWRADHGGQTWKMEQPQTETLKGILTPANDVKAIVLSIGGNDIGFGTIVSACVNASVLTLTPCAQEWESKTRSTAIAMMDNIRHTIDDIRTTMANAGYQNSDYRLIVQGYPRLVPDKANLRQNNAGCPLYADDAEWVNKILVPRLAGGIRQAVRASNTNGYTNAQFLDLQEAFKGHELCGKDAQYSTTSQPAREVAEWVNWVNLNADPARLNESAHPNYYGQLAMQDCLRKMLDAPSTGNFRCANEGGAGHVGLTLSPLGDSWSSYAPAQVLTAGQWISPGTCKYAVANAGRLCFQVDGNLVNYRGSTLVWSAGTAAVGGGALFQTDGNLAVWKGAQSFWNSNSWGNPDSELVLSDDGYVRILNPAGTVLWTTAPPGAIGGTPGGPGGDTNPPHHEN